jgi:EAL domain-containing protein (putative c-di-GMP-specific phosphodiesterase class I)
LKVVAEGVETDDQAKFLIQSGCDSLQGFLYSRPVEPDVWMANQKKSDSGKLSSAQLS